MTKSRVHRVLRFPRLSRVLPCLALGVASLACQTPGSAPRVTAEAFLDAHYVRIDLEAGLELCTGLALEKLNKEIALTRGNPIGEDTRRPRVSYTLEQFEDHPDRAQYAYELQIAPGGADTFRKSVVLSLRDEGEGWRVSNYSESDVSAR